MLILKQTIIEERKVAGSRERIAIPYFDILGIQAIFDPGLKESQITVENIKVYEGPTEMRISFDLPGLLYNRSTAAIIDISENRFVSEKNALAYLVETQIIIGKQLITTGMWIPENKTDHDVVRLGTSEYSEYFYIDYESSFILGNPQHSVMEMITQPHTKHN